MQYQILVVEDDADIVSLLKLYLESENYIVYTAQDGIEALEVMQREEVNLAILDIMMPNMDGFTLTKKIRENNNIPILILSAKDTDNDKILGLKLGADDYLAKPFNPAEVMARVNSLLRRFYQLGSSATVKTDSVLKVRDLLLDTHSVTLTKHGEVIPLTSAEYKILAKLMASPGRVYAKAQLYESISSEYLEIDENTVMVHISHLREKIEDDPKNPQYIKTLRGIGYKIEA